MDLSLENGVISPRLLKPQSVGDSLLVQWLLWAGFPQTCPPSPPHSGVGRREGPVGGQAFGGPLENPPPHLRPTVVLCAPYCQQQLYSDEEAL